MMNINTLLILGGDSRQKYMACELLKKGYKVFLWGFKDEGEFPQLVFLRDDELYEKIKLCDAFILPLPVTSDNENIKTECGNMSIMELLNIIGSHQTVFAGMMSDFYKSRFFQKGVKVFDYFDREELKIKNALPTAQGVLKIILESLNITLESSKICVTGYGRTSKILTKMLSSLGADVTVSARKCGDLAWAQSQKLKGVYLKNLSSEAEAFDVIINTVPSLVIDEKIIKNLKSDCLLIEIASYPYGIDFESAKKYKIKLINAPSLPGRVAPKTAGKIISDTISNIIEEGR